MYASKYIVAALLIALACSASADILESWGDGAAPSDFDWDIQNNRLTIYHGNGNNYKFWFHDGGGTPGTGIIDNIVVDPNATGDFTLNHRARTRCAL